jgi:hypothetical protein
LVINCEILGTYKRSVSSKYFMKLVMLDIDMATPYLQGSSSFSREEQMNSEKPGSKAKIYMVLKPLKSVYCTA